MKKQKVVLAYSGGLDTSYCVKYLSVEKNLDVYTILVNTGGFCESELKEVENRAKLLGAKSHKMIDVTHAYYQKCIRYLVYGNVLKNHTYPLSVSAERVFQAMAVANFAGKINADYIAHGSTGAGNDQVRFDLNFHIMAPDIPVLSPIRDQKLSRDQEITYLESNGIKLNWEKAQYSINQGLWGTSVGGKETLTSNTPLPEKAYPTKVEEQDPTQIELYFKKGQYNGFDHKVFDSPVQAITELNELAAPFGIGRDIHVGDTLIGIKGRVGFEAAAPILIIKAHEALEKHVLTKWQIHWKEQLANWYGMLLHEGQYLDPVMRDIEVFLENTQKTVNGTVHLKLDKYRFEIEGIDSPNDLMNPEFGHYGEMHSAWTGEDVRGFAKILSNQSLIYRSVNNGKDS
jgi:argininosuccinate synthase